MDGVQRLFGIVILSYRIYMIATKCIYDLYDFSQVS